MKIGPVLRTIILSLIALGHVFSSAASAGNPSSEEATNEQKEELDVTGVIMHHIMDSHDWHIMDWDGHPISMPLPIILWTENGLVTGMSSAFHHDDHATHVADFGGQRFVKTHGHIYEASAEPNAHGQYLDITVDDAGVETISNVAPLDLSITKNAASIFIGALIMLLIFLSASRAYSKEGVPRGIASFIEPLVEFVRDDVAKPNIGEKYAKYVPYLCTLFFFIWINNMLGLIPFIPGGANTTGNIAVTMVLAVFTMFIILFSSNAGFWKHIFWMPGVPVPVKILLAPIEFIGIFTKPFALMIRLFANMTAGHIVILSLISLIFIFESEATALASVPLTLFIFVIKVLVAFLQAYIFSLLTALFIGQAMPADHH